MTTTAAASSLSHGTLVLMLIACLVLGLASGFATWSAWHREKIYEPRSPYTRGRQEEHLRVVPAGTVGFGLWALVCVVDLIWGQHAPGARIAIGVLGLSGLGAILVGVSAGTLGRPQWAIPPALRDHPRPEHPQLFDQERSPATARRP